MRSTDRFLIGIVAGVVVLVVVAFAVAFARPQASYGSEDTPQGVAQNYLLALRQRDYARAYGYLAPDLPGYPRSTDAFIDDVTDNSWAFRTDERSVSFDVAETQLLGADRALITIREHRFYAGGLFNSGETVESFDLQLHQVAGLWKVAGSSSYSYWMPCWERIGGCD